MPPQSLASIHGARSVHKLSTSSAQILASVRTSAPPVSAKAAIAARTQSTSARTREHAALAGNGHERKLEAMTALLNQMKMLREQPVLTSKLRQIAEGLAKVMLESPDSAAFLSSDTIESKLRTGALAHLCARQPATF